MIDTGQDCTAVLTQVMAAKSALNQVSIHVVAHAMKHCMATRSPTLSQEEVVDEAIKVFLKYSSCVR
jgi:DNA-binding FrmR family transcriptional regulator